jgi:hypothetical protein
MSEITVPDAEALILHRLTLNAPAQVNRSRWTGRRKVVGLAGCETWRGRATIDVLATEAEERPWRAFLFDLQGPVNWFRWPLPCNRHIGPKPTVAAGAGSGYTLPLTGMQPSTRILARGQFMTVPLPSGHYRAVCLSADLVSDGSGNATATFKPALNEVPTLGATIETGSPFVPMSPVETELGLDSDNGVSGASFDVEEAL